MVEVFKSLVMIMKKEDEGSDSDDEEEVDSYFWTMMQV